MTLPSSSGPYEVPEESIASWQAVYRAVGVREQLGEMAAWLEANPKKRPKNVPRFVVNWLSRQNSYAKNVRREGAYREPKGARGAYDEKYRKAYEQARDEGFSIEAAARMAKRLVGTE